MSGECDACGHHVLECMCKGSSVEHGGSVTSILKSRLSKTEPVSAERAIALLDMPGDPVGASDGGTYYLRQISPAERDQIAATIRALLAERDALQGQLNDLRNGWANSVKAHAALLAERDAAFAAGQEDMRERAAQAANFHAPISSIRALPINPRP